MTETAIDPKALKQARTLRRLTQTQLAKEVRVNKQTIYRLERGRVSSVREKTAEALCRALKLSREVLSGQEPIPDSARGSPQQDESTFQLNARVSAATLNSFRLVSDRYGVPFNHIVELAPALFYMAAEKSLKARAESIEKLSQSLDATDSLTMHFPHLPRSITPTFEAVDAIAAEEESIAARDIFGRLVEKNDQLFWRFGPVQEGYESAKHNPFSFYLLSESEPFNDDLWIEFVDTEYGAGYQVCRKDAIEFCGGDTALAFVVLSGLVLLRDMPPELTGENSPKPVPAEVMEKRVSWLREQAAVARERQKQRTDELLEALGLLSDGGDEK